ncbi:MAG: cytochrome c peroxidase [Woeseiaceae bacterium]|nr:cytochrome c peroxidase [Woeseiaceae bacterium]
MNEFRRLSLMPFVTAIVVLANSAHAGLAARTLVPATPVDDRDYYDSGQVDGAKVSLGAQLFYDKVLSGNFNISCATCHHSFTGTSDGLALPIGEGGRGLGVTRDTGVGANAVHERVPRNAPQVFNLGAREFEVMFHDGRVQPNPDYPNGIESPAGHDLPEGLDNVLAVQAMFPVTSGTEMAGQAGENPVADAAAAGNLAGPGGVWEQLTERLRGLPAYVEQFIAVYPDVTVATDIRFTHAANAIAAFEAANWRADNSPFDRFLRGERGALSLAQRKGMSIFYSPRKGDCASCHSGTFQTDQSFRAIAMPQIGPGKGDGAGYEDFGRERVTGDATDRYKFRVPALRNVAQTAPYGHAGAYDTLEAVVRHHLDPVTSLYTYDPSQLRMPGRPDLDAKDLEAMSDTAVVAAIAGANELSRTVLTDEEIGYLIDFLHALTDPAMLDLRNDVPRSLPSGLRLAD